MPTNLENSAVATGLEKMFSVQSQRKAMPKNVQTTAQFHVKMRTIKDRNDMDLIEAEDIKKVQEYPVELYKKDRHDPDN